MSERTAARRIDLAIAGGLLVVGQLEIALWGVTGSAPAAHALWAAAAAAVLLRRAHPLLFLAWALAVHLVATTEGLAPPAVWGLYTPLALFGVAAYVRDPRHVPLAAAGSVAAYLLLRVGFYATGVMGEPLSLALLLAETGWCLPAVAAGVLLRDRTDALLAARERAARAADDGVVGLALADERARIARELHAVVRSQVRAVLDDVAAARAALAMRSGAARGALRRAAGASQRAMGEMRRMLSLLRSDNGPVFGGGFEAVRPDAADVPATLGDLVAHRRALRRTVDVRRIQAGAPLADTPLPPVAMRVLVALAELPGSTRMTVERATGVVRASTRVARPLDTARIEALAERARLAGGRLRRGRLRRGRVTVTLPAEAPVVAPVAYRPPWLSLPAGLRAQGLPLMLLAIELVEALLPPRQSSAPAAARIAGACLIALAFVPRRKWPVATVLAVCAIAAVRIDVAGDHLGLYPALYVAAFVAGAYVRPLWATTALGLLPTVTATAASVASAGWAGYPPSSVIYTAVLVGAAWLTGLGGRRRLAQADELRELTAEEERRQGSEVARAVDAERLRVARELHDLVGHGLTAITLQCAAAERLLETRPADAAAAIGTVEEVAREVLRELRALLAALDGAEHELPELTRLSELARRAEAHGLTVRLELLGELGTVPAGHAGAAYRIVQEGLTNAAKHGGDGPVEVRVALDRGQLTVAVRSGLAGGGEAEARPVVLDGSGLGIAGMRERVRVYGGWLVAGPTHDGAWLVRAELPLAGARVTV